MSSTTPTGDFPMKIADSRDGKGFVDSRVGILQSENATLRQRVGELEAQLAEMVNCRAALNRELIREQKRLKHRDAERDALQETVDRQLDQLAAANEKVRVLREYAKRMDYAFIVMSSCDDCGVYSNGKDVAICRKHADMLGGLNEQRRAALEATKEGK